MIPFHLLPAFRAIAITARVVAANASTAPAHATSVKVRKSALSIEPISDAHLPQLASGFLRAAASAVPHAQESTHVTRSLISHCSTVMSIAQY